MRILEWAPVVKPPVAETRVEVVVDEPEVAVVRQQKGKRRRVRGSDQNGALATLRFTLLFQPILELCRSPWKKACRAWWVIHITLIGKR